MAINGTTTIWMKTPQNNTAISGIPHLGPMVLGLLIVFIAKKEKITPNTKLKNMMPPIGTLVRPFIRIYETIICITGAIK